MLKRRTARRILLWLYVFDGEGDAPISRRAEATEDELEGVGSEIATLGSAEARVIGIDLLGGPATFLEMVLLERGERVRCLPVTAVNKVRDAYPGGEHKSVKEDAFVIADQLRLRWKSLREVRIREENATELRTLVG